MQPQPHIAQFHVSARFLALLEELKIAHELELRELRQQLEETQNHEQAAATNEHSVPHGDLNSRSIDAHDSSSPGLLSDCPALAANDAAGGAATPNSHTDQLHPGGGKSTTTHGAKVLSTAKSCIDDELVRSTSQSYYLRQLNHNKLNKKLLDAPFDIAVGFCIVLNSLGMFLELECKGLAYEGGYGDTFMSSSSCSSWNFAVIEQVFTILFTLELALRLVLLRTLYFYDKSQGGLQKFAILDAAIVAMSCIDGYVLSPMGYDVTSVSFLRLLRISRVAKSVRMVRVVHLFGRLRLMVLAMSGMGGALFWSLVILGLVMFMYALVLTQLLNPYIGHEPINPDIQQFIIEYYGTSTRSLNSMFELTFSGCWPNYTRPLLQVSMGIVWIFWAYVVVIIFGTTRVITALFLKDTLQCSERDANMMVRVQQKQRDAYIGKLNEWFEAADTSGDGVITIDELDLFLSSAQTLRYLQLLELEVHDACSLFYLLDNGNGKVTREEFLKGILQLKGHARELDVVAIKKECQGLRLALEMQHKDVHQTLDACVRIDSKVTRNELSFTTTRDASKVLVEDDISRLQCICDGLENWLAAQNRNEYATDFTKRSHPHELLLPSGAGIVMASLRPSSTNCC